MNDQAPGLTLDDIRRKIDACDDSIVELLAQRFQFVEQVKFLKRTAPGGNQLPLRPAREMAILRRIVGMSTKKKLSPELLVRLWPMIISQASQIQSPVTIHVPKRLYASVAQRQRIRDYFAAMPVEECRDESQALVQVNSNPSDICIVETESGWADPYLQGHAGTAQVIGALPVIRSKDDNTSPKLLVIGHAPQEATGDDETIVISNGALPRAFSPMPLWQAKSGDYRISALPGFLAPSDQPFVSLTRSNPTLGLRLVGRYPSAIGI
jgi:chorismate mutase